MKFYQTKSNAIILQGVLPPSCIVRAERLKGGEPLYKRQYLSPRPPPKISLRNDLNWTRGTMIWALQLNIDQSGNSFNSHLEKQFISVLPSQPNPPKTNGDRSGKPVASRDCRWCVARRTKFFRQTGETCVEGRTTCPKSRQLRKLEREEAQHIVQENYHLKSRDTVDKFDFATDDTNIDFSVSGIPEEAVKRSENFSILQLIRRITRHPQKQAVQNDLDQKQSFNAFSAESKKAIKESGNIEISEIVNAEPKWQCKSCLNHCNP